MSDFDFSAYKRKYYATHPEKALAWRINAAIRLLTREGYTITPPMSTDVQKAGESR